MFPPTAEQSEGGSPHEKRHDKKFEKWTRPILQCAIYSASVRSFFSMLRRNAALMHCINATRSICVMRAEPLGATSQQNLHHP